MISSAESEALRLVDAGLSQTGVAPAELRLVVLVGSRGGRLVQALAERCPALPALLVLEPDAQAARRVHELRASDPRWQGRLVLYGPDQLLPAQDFVAAYLTIGQFLMRSQLGPRVITRIVNPATAESPLGRSLCRALFDLSLGFSREFLHAVASKPEFSAVLRGVADFFAAQGEPYHALKFYSSLPVNALTPEVVRAAWGCLLKLGSAPLIQHFLAHLPLAEPERSQLVAQVPAELAPAELEQTRRLERNLGFLEPHFPEAVATLRQAAAAPDLFTLELLDLPWRARRKDGAWLTTRQPYPLLVRATGRTLSEENPLVDLSELASELEACAATGQDHVCIGRWVKYWAVAGNVIAEPTLVKQHGWQRITFLLEHDVPALRRLLGATDLEPWFEPSQVRLLLGSSAVEQLSSELERNVHQPVPELFIGVPAEAREQLLARRAAKLDGTKGLLEALEARYRQHPERLCEVLRSNARPLRIAFMTSRYTTVLQYVTRDLAEAFELLGHRCRIFCEARPGEELVSFAVAEQLLELEPDVLFVIDHIRPEYQGLLPSGLPVVTWVLDELPALKDRALIRQLGSLDLTYGFNGAVARSFRELGYPTVGQLPFAVNPARYFAEPPDPAAQGIAFTTHIGQFSDDPAGAGGLNALLAARFERLPEIPLEMGKILPDLQACLGELGLRPTVEEERRFLYHALQLARQQDRERVALQVLDAGLPLHVYGLGWDKLPRFAAAARGIAAPGPALRRVYREHRAVLHVNRGCNIHPRVLETLCAGGLVIARWDPVDDEPGETCDQLGDDLCLFRSAEELTSLLRRVLEDDGFRDSMVRRGQARVLAQHTYESRARKILGDLALLLEAHLQKASASGARPQPSQEHACST